MPRSASLDNNYIYRTGNGILVPEATDVECTGNAVVNCSKIHARLTMEALSGRQ